jgi:hypothetical protein
LAILSHVGRLLVLVVCLGALLVRVPLGLLEFELELEQACSSRGCCCADPAVGLSCCSGETSGPIWVDACGCGGHEQDFGIHLAYDWSGEPTRVELRAASGAEPAAELFEAPVDGRSPSPDPPIPRFVRPVGQLG